MLALRIIGLLVALTVGASVVTFLVTRDRRWLRFAFQAFKYGVLVALLIVRAARPGARLRRDRLAAVRPPASPCAPAA